MDHWDPMPCARLCVYLYLLHRSIYLSLWNICFASMRCRLLTLLTFWNILILALSLINIISILCWCHTYIYRLYIVSVLRINPDFARIFLQISWISNFYRILIKKFDLTCRSEIQQNNRQIYWQREWNTVILPVLKWWHIHFSKLFFDNFEFCSNFHVMWFVARIFRNLFFYWPNKAWNTH